MRVVRPVEAEPGIWLVVVLDVVMFCSLFALYLVYRDAEPEVFRAGQAEMSTALGLLNTLVLLASSVAVVAGVNAARSDAMRDARRLFGVATACGAGFVVVKAIEWSVLTAAGATPRTDDFFMLYYGLAGMHLLHVLIGLLVLVLMRRATGREVGFRTDSALLGSGAVFWHMVDLLWLVIFTLVYFVS
jgi:nitric oxide reductase NorE protein